MFSSLTARAWCGWKGTREMESQYLIQRVSHSLVRPLNQWVLSSKMSWLTTFRTIFIGGWAFSYLESRSDSQIDALGDLMRKHINIGAEPDQILKHFIFCLSLKDGLASRISIFISNLFKETIVLFSGTQNPFCNLLQSSNKFTKRFLRALDDFSEGSCKGPFVGDSLPGPQDGLFNLSQEAYR